MTANTGILLIERLSLVVAVAVAVAVDNRLLVNRVLPSKAKMFSVCLSLINSHGMTYRSHSFIE